MSETAGQPEGPLSPTARRRALVICNGKFEHLNLSLAGVSRDAENLTRLLGDKERAGFEVTCLLDKGLLRVRKAIAKACGDSGKDDTLLIYYSGTSTCDDNGELLIPVADSDNESLMATCIEPDFILSQMRRSDCRRFVLVIDGCHSGAFFATTAGSRTASSPSLPARPTRSRWTPPKVARSPSPSSVPSPRVQAVTAVTAP